MYLSKERLHELVTKAVRKAEEKKDKYWNNVLDRREEELKESYTFELAEKETEIAFLARKIEEDKKVVLRAERAYKECLRRIKETDLTKRELEFQVERMEKILGEFAQVVHASIDAVETTNRSLLSAKTSTEKDLNLAVISGGRK